MPPQTRKVQHLSRAAAALSTLLTERDLFHENHPQQKQQCSGQSETTKAGTPMYIPLLYQSIQGKNQYLGFGIIANVIQAQVIALEISRGQGLRVIGEAG